MLVSSTEVFSHLAAPLIEVEELYYPCSENKDARRLNFITIGAFNKCPFVVFVI